MISKATISFVQSLKQKKYRQKYNKFLLEGEKIILEGLEEGIIKFDTIFCLANKEHLLEDTSAKYNIIDSKTLKKLSSLKNPPGIIGIANMAKKQDVSSLSFEGVSLYLDDIKDPGNMGTIIRTADWFGIRNIIASPESVEFHNPKVIQSTMGSFTRLNLVIGEIGEIPETVGIYASTLGGTNLYEFRKPKQMVLVIGSESHGVSESILNLSAQKLTIPKNINTKAESLNAGIATAIFLSFLTQQI